MDPSELSAMRKRRTAWNCDLVEPLSGTVIVGKPFSYGNGYDNAVGEFRQDGSIGIVSA